MQQEELTALIEQTAALMAQYERRGAGIDARLHTLGNALEGLTRQLPGVVAAAANSSLQTLPAELTGMLRERLDRTVGDYRTALQAASHEAEKAAQALTGQITHLRRLHRLLVWKVLAASAFTLVLLLAGGLWLSLHYTRVIRDQRLAADLMRAYNNADVALCGSASLCANVDSKGERYGEHRQYLPVRSRP